MSSSAPARRALDARSLIRSASWMSGAHVAAQLCAYGSLLILAHFVPPKTFGTVAVGTAILNVGIVFMDFGTRGSIVVARSASRDYLRRSLVRCVSLGIVLSAAIALGAGALSRTFASGADPAALAALGVGIPLYGLAVVPMSVLQRAMEFGPLARVWASSNFVSALGAVVAGVLGAGVWALVGRQVGWCAVLAVLAWVAARRHLPRKDAPAPHEPGTTAPRWFLLFALTQVVTFNLDYFVIGHQNAVAQLGLYSVAFMIAFAPLQHFSGEVGRVLFSAAAASGVSENGARTVVATRLMALLLLPLLPVTVALAVPVLPAVLGHEWSGMVVPFELLAIAGVGYSIVNCIGEALAGGGQMEYRSKLNVVWCVITLAALVVLVRADGIRGAALAHLFVFAGYAAVYATAGMRRIGSDGGTLWRALRPVIVAVALQAIVTAGVDLGLHGAGAGAWAAGLTGAAAGLAVLTLLMTRGDRAPLREALALMRMAAQRAGG
ncbi:MAG: oligosaccharide flippase family protein [Thermoleophilaceae bacterium]